MYMTVLIMIGEGTESAVVPMETGGQEVLNQNIAGTGMYGQFIHHYTVHLCDVHIFVIIIFEDLK